MNKETFKEACNKNLLRLTITMFREPKILSSKEERVKILQLYHDDPNLWWTFWSKKTVC